MTIYDFNKTFSPQYYNLAKVCKHLGTELNDRKNRFDKSDILEQALEAATGNKLRWVDEQGYDHYCPELDYKAEMKTESCALYSKKTKKLKGKVSLKLTNTLQNKNEKKKLEETANDLIIVDSFHGAVGRVPYSVAIEHAIEIADGFKTEIPIDKIEILFEGITENNELLENSSYMEQKKKMQKDYVQSFFVDK